MGQQVVTELVISADTSGVDRFSQAMASAEQAAGRGVDVVGSFGTGLLALSAGAAGAVAAFLGAKAVVDTFIGSLTGMQTVAHQVGLTLTEFQGVQFGGAIKGLSTDQINSGLEKSASLLNDASRNSNSLSKELDANGISIKNANGQLISENQLLGVAANLIKNANNPGDQLAIAQMLGFTKEWIPLLERGAGAMSGLAEEAKAAGAVIDDETINKAAEFDAEWRKSSVEFQSYMKASLEGLLPFFDTLIQKTIEWLKTLPGKPEIQKAVDENNAAMDKAIAEAMGLPENDSIAIKFEVTQAARDSWDSFTTKIGKAYDLLKWLSQDENTQKFLGQLGDVDFLKNLSSGGPGISVGGFESPVKARFIDPNSVPGFAASQISEPTYPSAEQYDAAFDKANPANPGSRKNPLAGLTASDYGADGTSKVAAKDVSGDAVDRAINSLNKHVEAQKADTLAVGLGDAALAGFKATAAETAAVLANHGKETEAQAASFAKVRLAAIDAADALAKAKVASSIEFSGKTAFLSADDLAIATQLKGIYGNDVPAALDSTYASAIRVNNAFKGVSSAIETNLTSGLTDIVTGTKSVSQGFSDMGLAIVKALDQALIKMLVVEPIMRTLQSLMGGFGVPAVGTAGSPFFGPVAPSAHGNMFDGGNIIPFASGGVVGGPTLAPMALFGEAGPEAIVPLKRGADGNLGVASSGGGGGGGVSFGDIHINVPEGTTPDNAAAIGAAVKNSMTQVIDERLNYHMRSRGMLNRAA